MNNSFVQATLQNLLSAVTDLFCIFCGSSPVEGHKMKLLETPIQQKLYHE